MTPIKISSSGFVQIVDPSFDIAELEFFNVLLKLIIERTVLEPISDAYILTLIEDAANEYKSRPSSTTDSGVKILTCLRNYWKYKHNSISGFIIPEDMPVIQSIMAFFLKPFGFDQIERFMLNKKYTEKGFAMMLWAACNGYAALPKTFTAVLYQEISYFSDMDDLLLVTYDLL